MRMLEKRRFLVAPESIIIFCIGMLDLVTTLIWVDQHGAEEGNPLFRAYLSMGPIWFALAKLVLLICPIMILETANRLRPRTGRWGSRFAIAAYLAFYGVGVLRLNPQILNPNPPSHHDASMSLAEISPEKLERFSQMMSLPAKRDQVNRERAAERALLDTVSIQ